MDDLCQSRSRFDSSNWASVWEEMKRGNRVVEIPGLRLSHSKTAHRVMPLADSLDSLYDLCETRRTVGVSEKAIGRMHAMYFSICPLRNPALLIKGRSGLVSKESADTTDGEQCRLAPRSRRRLMRYVSEHGFNSHSSPPSSFSSMRDQERQQGAMRIIIIEHTSPQPLLALGNPPVPLE
jgi:hypothetical protein